MIPRRDQLGTYRRCPGRSRDHTEHQAGCKVSRLDCRDTHSCHVGDQALHGELSTSEDLVDRWIGPPRLEQHEFSVRGLPYEEVSRMASSNRVSAEEADLVIRVLVPALQPSFEPAPKLVIAGLAGHCQRRTTNRSRRDMFAADGVRREADGALSKVAKLEFYRDDAGLDSGTFRLWHASFENEPVWVLHHDLECLRYSSSIAMADDSLNLPPQGLEWADRVTPVRGGRRTRSESVRAGDARCGVAHRTASCT